MGFGGILRPDTVYIHGITTQGMTEILQGFLYLIGIALLLFVFLYFIHNIITGLW